MLKKSKYMGISIIMIIIVMAIAVTASGTGEWESLGSAFRGVYSDADKSKIIAKLDGESITQQEYNGKKIFMTALYEKNHLPKK